MFSSNDTGFSPVVQEAPIATKTPKKKASIGLPKCENDCEQRFPLTPEAVQQLVAKDFVIKMESNAGAHIHYPDSAYVKAGARIVSRDETLACDMVIHLAPLPLCDIRHLRRGAILLSFANFNREGAVDVIRQLIDRRVINIAVDLIHDRQGNHPFADILAEIDGRCAITLAAAMFANSSIGKGILLGGIAGVMPCEVTIIGSCLAARGAAKSALGLGAVVRMFDNDVYRLRSAIRQLGDGVIASSIHPHALENALRSADVVIVTNSNETLPIEGNIAGLLKRGVLLFDLSSQPGTTFPHARTVNVCQDMKFNSFTEMVQSIQGDVPTYRLCFTNTGNAVARTAAMALSDTFVTLLMEIQSCEEASAMLPMHAGMRDATLTFMGKAVNRQVAELAGLRHTDIRLLLTLS